MSLDLESVGTGLEPGTTYYYRVIAARIVPTEDTTQWEEPTVFGVDQTFTTAFSGVKAPQPCVGSSCPGFGGTPPPRRIIIDCAKGFRTRQIEGKSRCARIHHRRHKRRPHRTSRGN